MSTTSGNHRGEPGSRKRTTPESLPESLRALERKLADVQYAATVAVPLGKEAADRCVKRLGTLREQISDLARFIERRLS